MKLFYAPGACSIGIHVLLEEIGKPYELHKLDLRGGEQYKPPFVELNPKSKVPTLQRDDGSVLTEFPVIAHWLGETHPEAGLMLPDKEAALRASEAMDYAVSTIHMQGFSRLFRPTNYSPSGADEDAVKARGKELVEKGFNILAHALGSHDYIGGSFSIADAALFYVEFWGATRMGMTLPAPLDKHFERLTARPAIAAVLKQEGFA